VLSKEGHMKKTIRFAALVAVMGLTSWLTVGARPAQALAPCDFFQGKICYGGGWGYCDPGGICYCLNGHWDCY
jgi:hypothetical protein